MVLGTNLSIFLLTGIMKGGTFVELLVVLPLGVAGDGLVGIAVFAALDDDDDVLVLWLAVHGEFM